MYEWLNMWAEQYGSHEALCDNKGSYSYESLNTSVKNLSIGFADMGLRKSDKVILQLDNCNEFVIVCFALMSMGVIPILAVPGLRVNDLDIIAKKANPVMYIRPDEYMGFIYAETGRKLQIMNPSIKYVLGTSDINKMMEQSNNSAVEIEQPKAEDIGLILLSGGTTNIPKLIPVTHSQTPQVWIDFQIFEINNGLNLSWDAVDELFPDGMLDKMFAAFVAMLNELVSVKDWNKYVELLPDLAQERGIDNITEYYGKLHVLNMKADDYIEKPINIDELEEKMLQLLHKLS